MKKCCVTGHRPQTLNKLMKYGDFNDIAFADYCDTVGYVLDHAVREGYDYFISGGAIGVDMDFAEFIIHFKETFNNYENVKLEIAVPCENQDLKWFADDKKRYASILSQADFVTKVGKDYTPDCMQKRNEYMVDNSDKVLAFWNGEEKGGTWNTIQYARSKGKEIEIIDLRKICNPKLDED